METLPLVLALILVICTTVLVFLTLGQMNFSLKSARDFFLRRFLKPRSVKRLHKPIAADFQKIYKSGKALLVAGLIYESGYLTPITCVIIIKKFYDANEQEFARGWVYYRHHPCYSISDLIYFDTSQTELKQFFPVLPEEKSCYLIAEVRSNCVSRSVSEKKLRTIIAYALRLIRYPEKLDLV